MNKLLIIGAGGHGRCCLDIATEMGVYKEIYFLDDGCVGKIINDTKVLGTTVDVEGYCKEEYEVFVAIGNNKVRKKIMEDLKKKGYKLPILCSPKSCVSNYSTVQEGTVIYPGVVVEANASIGCGCIATSNASINHDAVVNDYCLVYSNSVIRPNVVMEELVRVGSGCVISFGSHLEEGVDIPDGTVI